MFLPEYRDARRYLEFDLNADGRPEYFIENYAGAHSMNFALSDASGNPLVGPADIEELGGDRIVILNYQHNGYRDLVTSSCDCGGVDDCLWIFNGRRYVPQRRRHYTNDELPAASLERQLGVTAAYWYFDIWAQFKTGKPIAQ